MYARHKRGVHPGPGFYQRISRDLTIALDTTKKQVSHILAKLGAASRTEAAARARELGLIP